MHYGTAMPIRTVGEYFKHWGFTIQKPMKQAMNQKPEQVQTWLKEAYPLIHKVAKAEGAEIFWGDESNCVLSRRHRISLCQTETLNFLYTEANIHSLMAHSLSVPHKLII